MFLETAPEHVRPRTAQTGDAWSLTGPESWVLRYAPVTRIGGEPFKLALQDLVIRGALRVVAVRLPLAQRLRHPSRSAITAGHAFDEVAEPALAPLLELYEATPHRRLAVRGEGEQLEGILLEDFAATARKTFGGYAGYVERHVAPALARGGLLEMHQRRGRRPEYAYTDAGRAADARLDAWLDATLAALRRRPSGSSGPVEARLASGGGAALILHHLQPQHDVLASLVASGVSGAGSPDQSVAVLALADPAGLDGLDAFLAMPGFGGFGGGDGGGG